MPSKIKKCNQGKKKNLGRKTKIGGCPLNRERTIEGQKSKYCFNHGCQSCHFRNLKTTTTSFGEKCCESCKPKLEKRKDSTDRAFINKELEKEATINNFSVRNEQLSTEVEKISPDF
jgi:hypothetical protein